MAIVALAIAEMATAPPASDAIASYEPTTALQAIDEMAIAAGAVTPTDAKVTQDSPKASFRTPNRSLWIAMTKICSTSNQKSPTIHSEQEKEGPSDAVAATRIHTKTLKEPRRSVPGILSTSSTTLLIRIALRIPPKVGQNTERFLLGQKRSVRSSNRTSLTIRRTPRVAELDIVDPTIRNRFPLPTGGE